MLRDFLIFELDLSLRYEKRKKGSFLDVEE